MTNLREIEVIKQEVIPELKDICLDEIGIITPYNNQVNAIRQQLPDIEVGTVHKFQGREKEVIIMSVVSNQINDFIDDPHLINVAVSRAKKKFYLVVTGNEQEKTSNIKDLIDYIDYNNCKVVDSKVFLSLTISIVNIQICASHSWKAIRKSQSMLLRTLRIL